MSTLAEIEAAFVSLTPQELEYLESALHELRTRRQEAELEELYRQIGFVPLQSTTGKRTTREMVRQLREEEGI